MVFNITASLLGSVNFIATIIQLRAPGMTFMRMPFFVWAQFITAFLLLLAFPPLEAAGLMQFMDRVAGTSFFMPTGLVVNQQLAQTWSGGGSPILWQHLFWFLAHPEVYVLILPGIGMIAEIVANNTRKPLYGYKAMVAAILVLAFLSFIVWAHHMYMTGMGAKVAAFFQTTTIIISVPSVILLTALLISLWGGSIRFTVPMLFATAFLPMFGIGGLTGIPLAFNAVDIYLHDTYYIIAHFHYVVAPGTIFAIFAGLYYWYPESDGPADERVPGPGPLLGLAHLHQRHLLPHVPAGHGGRASPLVRWRRHLRATGRPGAALERLHVRSGLPLWRSRSSSSSSISSGACCSGAKSDAIPGTPPRVEWDAPSPPRHGNFDHEIAVYRGPYEYSVPGAEKDYTPQTERPSGTTTTPETSAAPHPLPGPLTREAQTCKFLTKSPPARIPASTMPSLASGCSWRRK